jgi:Rrf2 family transcriptional regulator, nitric oxide-sensitive transcriptional repressor
MLSMTAEYALRAVACLSAPPQLPLSADLLAERTKVPRRYLTRVLQDLARAGLVHSRPGPGGGYELAKESAEVTILDVVNAVSPLERIRACPLGLKSHIKLCPLHAELDRAYAATEAAFAGVTIKELLQSTNPSVPLCDTARVSKKAH